MAASEARVPPSNFSPPSPLPSRPSMSSPSSRMTKLLGPLAIVSYILSLPALALGVWLLATGNYNCEDLLRAPQIRAAVGVGLILVFSVSNFVVYFGSRILVPGHVVLSVVLVVMLSAGLSLVGLYKTETRGLPGTPLWLRSQVMNAETWDDIKRCLYDDNICLDLVYRTLHFASDDFSTIKLSPVESGCCKPPNVCKTESVNATYWVAATASKNGNDKELFTDQTKYGSFDDCYAWSNNSKVLCYDCQSCKMGFVKIISFRWKKIGVFLMVMSISFMTVHTLRFTILMLDRYSH